MDNNNPSYVEYRMLQLSNGERTLSDIANIIFDESNIAPYLIKDRISKAYNELLPHGYFREDIKNICAVHGATERFLVEYGYPSPVVVNWELTSACNSKCPHCYARAGVKKPHELELNDIYKVVDSLKILKPAVIDLSGGEPLLRKDFFEIATYTKEQLDPQYTKLKLLTNGTLINEDNVSNIAKLISFVHISIDGIEDTHDEFRGMKNLYQKAIQAINLLVQHDVPVCVTTTIHKKNLGEIPQIIDLALQLNVSRLRFGFFAQTGRGRENSTHLLSLQERKDIYEYITSQKIKLGNSIIIDSRERFYGIDNVDNRYDFINCNSLFCRAGTRIMFISSQGYVAPCYMLNEPEFYAGNIKEEDLIKIWRESKALNQWRELKISQIEKCSNCNKNKNCGAGMRCIAYGVYNRINAPDPFCIHYN